MIARVIVAPRARVDIQEATRWLAERSRAAAERWHDGLQKVFAELRDDPERHPIAEEESERFGLVLRQRLYGRRRGTYRILFSIEGPTVYVHHVRHSARGPIEP